MNELITHHPNALKDQKFSQVLGTAKNSCLILLNFAFWT